MNADLKSMTRKELERLRKDVDAALESVEAREMRMAYDAAAKAAADFGFSLNEVANMTGSGKRGGKGPKSTTAPKYRNPDNQAQTWTGRGRQPDWYKAAMAGGTNPESLEI